MKLNLFAVFLLFFLSIFETTNFYRQILSPCGITPFLTFFVLFSLYSNVYIMLILGFLLSLFFGGLYSETRIMGLNSLFFIIIAYFSFLLLKKKSLKTYWRIMIITLVVNLFYHFFHRFSLGYSLINKELFIYLFSSFLFNLIFIKLALLIFKKLL